jgi:DNA modification methylase
VITADIYCGDCLTTLPSLPPASVDMVLVDLPYGTTANKWDSCINLPALWAQYKRICKHNAAMVFTAQTPFDKILGCSNLAMLRYEWIWAKNCASGFMNAKKMPLKIHENVLVFYRELPTYNPQFTYGAKPYKSKVPPSKSQNYDVTTKREFFYLESDGRRYPSSILPFDREVGLHPTQKPLALMEYLIRTYTNPGETVLDNCMGSGTTGVACRNLRRNFIGIEAYPTYYAAADKRISDTPRLIPGAEVTSALSLPITPSIEAQRLPLQLRPSAYPGSIESA